MSLYSTFSGNSTVYVVDPLSPFTPTALPSPIGITANGYPFGVDSTCLAVSPSTGILWCEALEVAGSTNFNFLFNINQTGLTAGLGTQVGGAFNLSPALNDMTFLERSPSVIFWECGL